MSAYALSSEYHRLTPTQKDQVDCILADDGEWTQEIIALAIQFPLERIDHEDDWSKP